MCGICGKLDKNWLCKECEIKLKEQAAFCIENCSETTKYFDQHIYLFKYEKEIRDAILSYKFNEKSYIYKTFVNFLKINKKICNNIKKYDIILSVPISKKRFKERGYNQSRTASQGDGSNAKYAL